MIKQFFITTFTFSFFILMLLNIMASFQIGGFENVQNGYFGITTLTDAINVDAQIEGTISWYIADLLDVFTGWFNTLGQNVSDKMTAMINDASSLSVDMDKIWFANSVAWYSLIANSVKLFVNLVGLILCFVGMMFLYVYYLISIFFAFITGQYYSIMPSPTWQYPNMVGGYIPSTITI